MANTIKELAEELLSKTKLELEELAYHLKVHEINTNSLALTDSGGPINPPSNPPVIVP